MKKIINGKRYDTETATCIGTYEPYSHGDLHWFKETLYVTKNRAYFLHGYGNAASPYAESAGNNSTTSGEAIHVMTRDEAFTWAQENLDGDAVDQHFSDVIEDA